MTTTDWIVLAIVILGFFAVAVGSMITMNKDVKRKGIFQDKLNAENAVIKKILDEQKSRTTHNRMVRQSRKRYDE